jgi:hypothetical protein
MTLARIIPRLEETLVVMNRQRWAVVAFALYVVNWHLCPWPTRVVAAQDVEYRDARGRFSFSYPQSFGLPSPGTDDGFGNRVAAVRFANFSTQGIGGEVVVGQGRPSIDVLAVGGLYDDIASGTLPPALKKIVDTVVPPLTAADFCRALGRERHIDIDSAPFAKLSTPHREALGDLDRLGNHAPQVSRCELTGETIVFDKQAAMVATGPPRRSYGAVRFLKGGYSSVHLVRAGGSPSAEDIGDMVRVVNSFRARPEVNELVDPQVTTGPFLLKLAMASASESYDSKIASSLVVWSRSRK